jgi:radical SAM protein with 4Fe4S-binding SPASM domain
LHGYFFSKWFGKSYQRAMPFALSIEPTTSCNLRCPQCPSGLRAFTRPTGMLQHDLFVKLLPQVSSHLFSINFYFQGEPYLHPQFLDLVKMASSENIYTITSTNAHYLTDDNCRKTIESGLDEIIISMDGVTQEIYEHYRVGGQLDKVLEGTERLLQWKNKLGSRKPYVVFQFVVFKTNEHQISAVKELGKRMRADMVRIKTAQIYDPDNCSDIIPENPAYARYKKDENGKWQIKNKLLNQCWRMWHSCVITWDGSLVPCCFDKDAKYTLGSLQNTSFRQIWFSEAYRIFRDKILVGRNQIDICTNCTEGTKVWAE